MEEKERKKKERKKKEGNRIGIVLPVIIITNINYPWTIEGGAVLKTFGFWSIGRGFEPCLGQHQSFTFLSVWCLARFSQPWLNCAGQESNTEHRTSFHHWSKQWRHTCTCSYGNSILHVILPCQSRCTFAALFSRLGLVAQKHCYSCVTRL